jgi:hypothetical protein
MTPSEREVLNARVAELLHVILVRIRAGTWPQQPGAPDPREELNDLADLSHNLPRYIVGHDEFAVRSFEQLRAEVVKHVRKFCPNIDPAQHHYVQLLDMDAETFLSRYRDHKWNWPEPVAQLA